MPIKIRKTNKPCPFCTGKTQPVWSETEKLKELLSPRGRIQPRILTGVCVAHQKEVAISVKRARHLGLLPFTTQAL